MKASKVLHSQERKSDKKGEINDTEWSERQVDMEINIKLMKHVVITSDLELYVVGKTKCPGLKTNRLRTLD